MRRAGKSGGGADPQEQFARAVEEMLADERQVPGDDDATSDDPARAEELAVVTLLDRHRAAHERAVTGPTPAERTRMRERVLSARAHPSPRPRRGATASRMHDTPRHNDDRQPARGRGTGMRGRFAVAVAVVVCVLLAVSGLSVLLARDALPGDPLYAVKRAAEGAEMHFSFGEQSKGMTHLDHAAARVSEIKALTRRHPNPSRAPVDGYLRELRAFDASAAAGSRVLTAAGTNSDGSVLASLSDWASAQYQQLTAVRHLLPERAATRSEQSVALLSRIMTRVKRLTARLDCATITSGRTDRIGELPATAACGTTLRPVTPDASLTMVPKPPQAAANGGTHEQQWMSRHQQFERHASSTRGDAQAVTTPAKQPRVPTDSVPAPTTVAPPTPHLPTVPTPSPQAPPTIRVPLPLHLGTIDPLPGLPAITIG